MRKNLTPVLAGGLLLTGAALLALRWTDQSAPPESGENSGQEVRTTDRLLEKDGRDPLPSGKRQDRSPEALPTRDPTLQKTLETLANSTEEELPDRLEKITATWPRDGLPSSVASLFSKQSADMLRTSLLRRWASLDPAAVAAWAAPFPDGNSRAEIFQQVSLAWVAIDPAAAWDWVNTLPRDAARDSAMLSLLYEISNSSPGLAVSRADALPESPTRSRLIEHAIGNWAASDPQAALERVREIADPALRNTSLASLATTWAESDPSAAATLAADGMEPGPAQERAIAAIVQRWSQRDPAAARKWIDSFPEGPIKQNAIEHLKTQTSLFKDEP
jgi:hypothetical protein